MLRTITIFSAVCFLQFTILLDFVEPTKKIKRATHHKKCRTQCGCISAENSHVCLCSTLVTAPFAKELCRTYVVSGLGFAIWDKEKIWGWNQSEKKMQKKFIQIPPKKLKILPTLINKKKQTLGINNQIFLLSCLKLVKRRLRMTSLSDFQQCNGKPNHKIRQIIVLLMKHSRRLQSLSFQAHPEEMQYSLPIQCSFSECNCWKYIMKS